MGERRQRVREIGLSAKKLPQRSRKIVTSVQEIYKLQIIKTAEEIYKFASLQI